MLFLSIILIGEVTKLFLLKKQKYFTPVRIIGMLCVFTGLALRKVSSNDNQFAIIGILLIVGLLIYIAGWSCKRVVKDIEPEPSDD